MRIDPSISIDNTDRWRLGPLHRSRQRTVNVKFEAVPAADRTAFRVKAWGSALPDDGNGEYEGLLHPDHNTLHVEIVRLIKAWRDEVVEYAEPTPAGGLTYPYTDGHDLSETDG